MVLPTSQPPSGSPEFPTGSGEGGGYKTLQATLQYLMRGRSADMVARASQRASGVEGMVVMQAALCTASRLLI